MEYVTLLNRAEIKGEAKDLMHRAQVSAQRFTLLFLAIIQLLSIIDTVIGSLAGADSAGGFVLSPVLFLGIVFQLIGIVLGAGYTCYCLGVWRGLKKPYSSLFEAFSFAGRLIGLLLLRTLIISLWTMLFIIPGIVAAFRYSFALWDLCQDPSLSVTQALALSAQQTRGYKMQLFSFKLSFLPWLLPLYFIESAFSLWILPLLPETLAAGILAMLVLYVMYDIALVYILPYIALSECNFFRHATAPRQADAQGSSGQNWG